MRRWLILFSIVVSTSSARAARNELEFQFGPVSTTVIQGEIAQQKAEGLILSHRPDSMNNKTKENASVWLRGGRQAMELYAETMISPEGEVQAQAYASVVATPVGEGSPLQAKYLLNVVELDPTHQIEFTDVESIRESPILNKKDKQEYEALLVANANMVAGVASLKDASLTESMLEEIHQLFLSERNEIIEKYEKELSFGTIAVGIRNALLLADELGLKTLTVPTLGYRDSGSLSLVESVGAILSGVRLYELQTSNAKEHDLKIVVHERATANSRKLLIEKLKPALGDGDFVDNAARSIRHTAIGIPLVFPTPSAAGTRKSLFGRVTQACRQLLTSGR